MFSSLNNNIKCEIFHTQNFTSMRQFAIQPRSWSQLFRLWRHWWTSWHQRSYLTLVTICLYVCNTTEAARGDEQGDNILGGKLADPVDDYSLMKSIAWFYYVLGILSTGDEMAVIGAEQGESMRMKFSSIQLIGGGIITIFIKIFYQVSRSRLWTKWSHRFVQIS